MTTIAFPLLLLSNKVHDAATWIPLTTPVAVFHQDVLFISFFVCSLPRSLKFVRSRYTSWGKEVHFVIRKWKSVNQLITPSSSWVQCKVPQYLSRAGCEQTVQNLRWGVGITKLSWCWWLLWGRYLFSSVSSWLCHRRRHHQFRLRIQHSHLQGMNLKEDEKI